MTKCVVQTVYYAFVVIHYLAFLHDMWRGVEPRFKNAGKPYLYNKWRWSIRVLKGNKGYKQFEYNRFMALVIIIGIGWISAYK